MVPNLLSPRPVNTPLLLQPRFGASSLSSPRREIGLMKLKGMRLSQHCGFQQRSFAPPTTPSRPFALRRQFITQRIKDCYLSHYISAYYCPIHIANGRTTEKNSDQEGSLGMHETLQINGNPVYLNVSSGSCGRVLGSQRGNRVNI